MDQASQKFSDLLSNRYKDLLKKEEGDLSPKKNTEQAQSWDGNTDMPPATPLPEDMPSAPSSFTASSQKQIEPVAPQVALADKLQHFTERVLSGHTYPSVQELIYKYGFDDAAFAALSEHKYKLMLDPDVNLYEKVSLQGEGGRNLFYQKHYASHVFTLMFNTYIEEHDYFKADNFIDDMLFNLIFSETQGAFDLEHDSNPRKVIENIINKEGALEPFEHLLINIYHSYAFILENEISEEALFELRKILTKNLDIKAVRRYRTDDLIVHGNLGDPAIKTVSPTHIELFMKKLFTYIDFAMSSSNPVDALISSLVIHYYFIYVSPYNEYNFILARLLSSWYIIRHPDILYKPLFLSEALSRDRHTGKYLKSLQDCFESGNDLTYFINYLADLIFSHSQAYIRLSKIISRTQADSIDLSRSEERAVKVILLLPSLGEGYFDWQRFKSYDQTDFSKQYYNRLLNQLEQKGVLTSRSKSSKLYRLDTEKFGL